MMGLYYYDTGIMIGLTVQIQQISNKIYQAMSASRLFIHT